MDGYDNLKDITYPEQNIPGETEGTVADAMAQEETVLMPVLPDIPYEMRKLKASDIPLFARIIGKLGIDELMSCYGDDDFTDMLVKLKNRRKVLGEGTGDMDEKAGNDQFILGAAVVTRMANKVILNLDCCTQEVFKLIGNLAGITAEEVSGLDLDVFMTMIIKVITENNIGNFIRAARVLLK